MDGDGALFQTCGKLKVMLCDLEFKKLVAVIEVVLIHLFEMGKK